MTKDKIEIGKCGYLVGMKSHFSAVYDYRYVTKDEIEIGECGYLMRMKSHFSAVYTHIVQVVLPVPFRREWSASFLIRATRL